MCMIVLNLCYHLGTNNIDSKKVLNAKTRKIAILTKTEEEINNDIEGEVLKSPKQIRALKFLLENEGYSILDELVLGIDVSKDIISRLKEHKYLDIIDEEIVEDKLELLNVKRSTKLIATAEQKIVIDGINEMFNNLNNKTVISKENQNVNKALIFGVTGSGKTEVYLQIIEEVINKGKSVILLVPEISLTHQTLTRFLSRFGNQIAVLHSKMSISKRKEEYRKIKLR